MPVPQYSVARLFGILAREAPVAVLLRRGPTDWVELIRWDMAADTFQRGQWFHGRIFERRSDLSPSGRLFVYFADKRGFAKVGPDYTGSWTAISRPPFFTALALWPKGDCWDGGGHFETERRLHLNHPGNAAAHPRHPVPKSLRVVTNRCGRGEDMPIFNEIIGAKGWRVPEGRVNPWNKPVWTKRSPDCRLLLQMELEDVNFRKPGGPMHFGFALLRASDGELLEVLDAQWADWDHSGRLVYSEGGKLFASRWDGNLRQAVELADFTADKPGRLEPPGWATHW